MKTRSHLIILASFALILVSSGTARASNADACTLSNGAHAECMGNYSQHTSEDYSSSTGCFGYCGPGCSYTCGSGGPCSTHDSNVRNYGLLSSQAISTFPPALRKWASCMTGRYVTTPTTTIFSRLTGYARSGWNKLSGLAW